jgi:hypothetical protein
MSAFSNLFTVLVIAITVDKIRAPIGEVPVNGPVQIKVKFSLKCAQFTSKSCPKSFLQVPCFPSLKQGWILIPELGYYRIALYADTTQGISRSGSSIILDTYVASNTNSLWTLEETPDTNTNSGLTANERVFYVKHHNTGSCFDVDFGDGSNGTGISMYGCSMLVHQKFYFPLM